ncbi:MAG: lytic transglycosylase domain-containing protein [Cytophagaceae bacterium]
MRKRISILLLLIVFLLTGKSSDNAPMPNFVFKAEHQNRHQVLIRKIPDDITFAGETVHFKTPEAYLKFERELKVNTSNNSSTRLLLKNARIWLPEIRKILVANKIPEDFQYLAMAESNLNNVVSPRGAAGFWQITDGTALHLGLEVSDEVDERYHPIRATRAACRYFKEAYREFGNWTSAAAAYNRGIYGLKRAYNSQNVSQFYDLNLNEETSRYLYRVLAIKDLVQNPAKYKMKQFAYRGPSYKLLEVKESIPDLEEFSRQHNISYELLKDYNPWILKNSLTIKTPGKSYTMLIPLTSTYLFGTAPEENLAEQKDSSDIAA